MMVMVMTGDERRTNDDVLDPIQIEKMISDYITCQMHMLNSIMSNSLDTNHLMILSSYTVIVVSIIMIMF